MHRFTRGREQQISQLVKKLVDRLLRITWPVDFPRRRAAIELPILASTKQWQPAAPSAFSSRRTSSIADQPELIRAGRFDVEGLEPREYRFG